MLLTGRARQNCSYNLPTERTGGTKYDNIFNPFDLDMY